ncbi:MAG TPA: hypothetical protein VEA63_07895, partial [Opitutus sp.]|nr:hypothetical protein [Opitutus sp.]
RRGYRLDTTKIVGARTARKIRETRGQLGYEWAHLIRKLKVRAPELARRLRDVVSPEPHPLFRVIEGEVCEWEKQPVATLKPVRLRRTDGADPKRRQALRKSCKAGNTERTER